MSVLQRVPHTLKIFNPLNQYNFKKIFNVKKLNKKIADFEKSLEKLEVQNQRKEHVTRDDSGLENMHRNRDLEIWDREKSLKAWNGLQEEHPFLIRLQRFNEIINDFKLASYEMDMEYLYLEDKSLDNSILSQHDQRDELARKMLLLQFKLVYFIYISDPKLHSDLISSSSSLNVDHDSLNYHDCPSSPLSISNVIDLITLTLQYRSFRHDMINLIISTLRKTVLFYDTKSLLDLSYYWFPHPEMKRKFIMELFLAYLREQNEIGASFLLQYIENQKLEMGSDLLDCFIHIKNISDVSNSLMNNQAIFVKLLLSSCTNLKTLNLEQLYQITNFLTHLNTQLSSSLHHCIEAVADGLLDQFCMLDYSSNQDILSQQYSIFLALFTKFQLVYSADKLWQSILLQNPTSHQISTVYKDPIRTLIEQFCLSPSSKRHSLGLYRYKRILAMVIGSPVGKGVSSWRSPVVTSQIQDWKVWWSGACTRNQCVALLVSTY